MPGPVGRHVDLDLSGRHALVCGASGGIGRAAAISLAELGANITVIARRADQLNGLRPILKNAGAGESHALVADLEKRDDLKAKVAAHLEKTGPVHILLNNTGGPPSGPLLEAKEEDFLKPYGRHLLAAHLLTQLVVPGMKQAGYGRIVNVLSSSVREPIPGLGVSNTIRVAMASWAKSYRVKSLSGRIDPSFRAFPPKHAAHSVGLRGGLSATIPLLKLSASPLGA